MMLMAPKNTLHRSKIGQYSDSETLRILNGVVSGDFEEVKVLSKTITLGKFPEITKKELAAISTSAVEAKIAQELYEALAPALKAEPNLLADPGVWAWVSLVPMREYMIARWSKSLASADSDSDSNEETKFDYFYTNRNNLKQHTRCGTRRLYIAAAACIKADGDFGNLKKFFESTDLYTGIFERRLGLDSEIAVELVVALSGKDRAVARYVLRSVELMLSTVSLEYLDRNQKRKLIADAISDFPNA
jgi:hypothetical protein